MLFPFNNLYIWETVELETKSMTKTVIYPPKDYQASFCRFLFRYGQLEGIKTDKALNAAMGRGFIGTFNTIIGKTSKILITKKEEEMECINPHNCVGEVIYYTCSKTKSIDFLRHLRNSIAHGNIHKEGKYFLIEDFKGKKRSACGRIESNKIKKLIEEYTKINS